ncbi:MAG: hypothetical protein ACRENS_01390 [Candidatus Eiseniibacteriota bacterium]
MNDLNCPKIEQLSELNRLPAGDSRRSHLDGCARCQARLIALNDFVAPGELELSEQELRSAEQELSRRRELGGALQSFAPRGSSSRLGRLFSWRPALAAAAVLIAVAGMWMMMRPGGEPALRGARDGDWQPKIDSGGGATIIRWSAVAGADGYRLEFFDASLQPIAHLDAGAVLTSRLAADSLPAGLHAHSEVLVRIDALRGSDVIAESRGTPLRVP